MAALHLCVDLQYRETSKFSDAFWAVLRENIQGIVRSLETVLVPTVFVAFSPSFTPFDAGVGLLRETPPSTMRRLFLNPVADFSFPVRMDDCVAYKTAYSVYDQPEIVGFFDQHPSFDTVVISGLMEALTLTKMDDCCVSRSVRDFCAAGYEVFVVAEGTNRGIPGTPHFLPLNVRADNHPWRNAQVLPLARIVERLSL